MLSQIFNRLCDVVEACGNWSKHPPKLERIKVPEPVQKHKREKPKKAMTIEDLHSFFMAKKG